MSAPRKIWVQPIGGIAFRTEQPSPEYSHVYATYHHDDVVRELVAALEDMLIVDSKIIGTDAALVKAQQARRRARAALAKIAQEG